jgi:hydroxypyruvate isomerase
VLWPLPGSIEARLETVAAAGIAGVALTSEHARWTVPERRGFERALHRLGLRVAFVGATPSWRSGSVSMLDPRCAPALRTELQASIEVALDLECELLLLLPGPELPGVARETQRRVLIESTCRCAQLAADAGLGLALEPVNRVDHPRAFVSDWHEAARVIEDVRSPALGLVLDVYHQETERGGALASLAALLPSALAVHVAGVPGRGEPQPALLDELRETLCAGGFAGEVSFEYTHVGDPGASLRRVRKGIENPRPNGGHSRAGRQRTW